MIVSIARVLVAEAEHAHLHAEWSNMVIADHPVGMIECWLLKGDGHIEIVSLWHDRDTHDAAAALAGAHPAYRIFDAADTTAEFRLVDVIGRITAP